jgi:hypothetical protein
MPFQTVAVPFDSYRDLPSAQARWVLMALARYADRDGRCWPSMRQLAKDARMSLSSVCRHLNGLHRLGCFSRERRPGGRYHYTLIEPYRPGHSPGRKMGVPTLRRGVPQVGTQQAIPFKHLDSLDDSAQWRARLNAWRQSGGRFWNPFWGGKPGEHDCFIPAHLLAGLGLRNMSGSPPHGA